MITLAPTSRESGRTPAPPTLRLVTRRPASIPVGDESIAAAFQDGDVELFNRVTRQHYRELHVHCYRMVGSFDEAEDLVQETLLRAWRKRQTFEGRSTIRAWLYRIATNVCIETIRRRTRRPVIDDAGRARLAQIPRLQPYPDALLDTVATDDQQPDALVVARETIELAFLAVIQLLPAKQRAAFILRDVLAFSAADTAAVLDDTEAAVNSALQRARATLAHSRAAIVEPAPADADVREQLLLRFFMDAQERADTDAMIGVLRGDVRMTLLPEGNTWEGRDAVASEIRRRLGEPRDLKCVAVSANRQPAIAVYARQSGDDSYRAWAIVLLDVVAGQLREIATFASPDLFERFGLPPTTV